MDVNILDDQGVIPFSILDKELISLRLHTDTTKRPK